MLTTRFTELVGCSVPIQQAGMGSHANPRLAAAVANAGGLGTICVVLLQKILVSGNLRRFLSES